MFLPGFHLFQIAIFLGRRDVESNNALLEIMFTLFKKFNDIFLCLKLTLLQNLTASGNFKYGLFIHLKHSTYSFRSPLGSLGRRELNIY